MEILQQFVKSHKFLSVLKYASYDLYRFVNVGKKSGMCQWNIRAWNVNVIARKRRSIVEEIPFDSWDALMCLVL